MSEPMEIPHWPQKLTFTERMLHIYTKEVHAAYETVEAFSDPQTRMSTEMPTSIRLAFENE